MPNQDDEQEKGQEDEVVEAPDESEVAPDNEQATDNSEETAKDASEDVEESGAKGPDEAFDSASNGEPGGSGQAAVDNEPPKHRGKIKRFFASYWRHKKWTLLLTLLVIIGILFAVPSSRYPLLALKMKRQFNVEVIDNKTDTPVSGAVLTLDGKTVTTDSAGKASLQAKVGRRMVSVSKKYYKSFSESVFVGVGSAHNSSRINLQATGRQLFIKVANKITGKPVANAEIKVLDTNAKTNSDGLATIVLPNTSTAQTATVTASGYNSLTGKLQVVNIYLTDAGKAANGTPSVNYDLTPSGRVYFLSNLSGNIDVVSTNLDGSGRQTVLAGTGNEDPNNTVLLASRDWKYLALLSKRDGGQYAKLYLINTSDNQLTTMDEGAATFTPVGWANHHFVYQVNRANVQNWQPGQQALKSFNADTGKINTLDQTTASGNQNSYLAQDFGYNNSSITAGANEIVYIKEWSNQFDQLNGKQDQILSIAPDGSGKQILKTLPTPANGSFQDISSVDYSPNTIYFQVESSNANGLNDVYYVYNSANNTVTQSNTLTADLYNQYAQNYPTYLLSPSGNQTFWSELRDGKNTLFAGDGSGSNGKQIATLSDYSAYGWYTDNYLLVEKGGSELYVMPPGGGTALKISDYYKPQRNFNGYGSGYGGL